MTRWGWLLIFPGVAAWCADNALSLAKQETGKAPSGFTAFAAGTGKVGAPKIVALKDAKKKALEIIGGDASANHYTLCRLDRAVPGDFNCTVKFRFLGGKGVQAAGVFYRMQGNKKDYYLLAVKPKEKKLFWTVFKNNVPVKGAEGLQIAAVQDGWHHLKFSCAANTIRWELNDRKEFFTYKTQFVPDYRAGAFGFWVRSDTRVQFADMQLLLPEAVVQKDKHRKLIEKLVLSNRRLVSLQFIARPKPAKPAVVMGSMVLEEIGQPGHATSLKAMDAGKILQNLNEGKTIRVVNIPLRGSDGKIIGVARLGLRSIAETSTANDLNFAAKIVKNVQENIPNHKALSIFP
jgi:hypothetical protein